MNAPLRVGVIGTGIMGTDEALILHRSVSGAVVTRLNDVDAERAGAVAAQIPSAQVAPDALSLIADDEVDAVVIASNDATHAELAVAAIRAGKPTMCEKPLAPTLDEAVRVTELAEREGPGLLSVGFMRRFDPGYAELKAVVGQRTYGHPLLVHCVNRGVSVPPGTPSEYTVIGSAVHDFDVIPWLLGSPIVEVAWQAPRSSGLAGGMQDPQLILLRTADGVLTSVESFLNARYGYECRVEVVAESGAVSLAHPARITHDSSQGRSQGHPADWRPRFADAYRLELQAWVDSVLTRTSSPLASAYDGLTAAAVSEAVLTSMYEGGRWVTVDVPPVGE